MRWQKSIAFILCTVVLCYRAMAGEVIPTPQKLVFTGERCATVEPTLRIDATLPEEGYRIEVTPERVEIVGGSEAGLFYGQQTFRQLQPSHRQWLEGVRVEDAPRFALRGFMYDTGRNFLPLDVIKEQLDLFAFYKLNVFHWHLTDNPAWRIQSKRFPQITSECGRVATRDPEASYSYDDIREVIAYAKARHILIIPELDMPGHSAFFKPVFGFEMASPQGIEVLKALISEFCEEIPAEDCPYLHIGSDEVHIAQPQAFMKAIEDHVVALGRRPIVWAPGLEPTHPTTIRQLWADGETAKGVVEGAHDIIDSGGGYLNLYDPQEIVRRHLAHPIPPQALGAILCCWTDTNVDKVENIFRHNAVYPALLAFSERAWSHTPLPLEHFEQKMEAHRQAYFMELPFDTLPQTRHQWWCEPLQTTLSGGTFLFAERGRPTRLAPKQGTSVVLKGSFTLSEARRVYLRIGFDCPARSNRYSGGIPAAGQWDANGGTVLLNGAPLPAPQWKEPGKYRTPFDTWFHPANEIPFVDEEFWWCREPVALDLPAGTHTLELHVPRALSKQYWSVTCLPVRREGTRWVDDPTLTFIPYVSSKEGEKKE